MLKKNKTPICLSNALPLELQAKSLCGPPERTRTSNTLIPIALLLIVSFKSLKFVAHSFSFENASLFWKSCYPQHIRICCMPFLHGVICLSCFTCIFIQTQPFMHVVVEYLTTMKRWASHWQNPSKNQDPWVCGNRTHSFQFMSEGTNFGMVGFEPTIFGSQNRRVNQAPLHSDNKTCFGNSFIVRTA